MAILLRQSTASQEIPLGYFVDSTDGDTEETGLTINNTDIKLWKSGATTLANKNSGGASHISNGIYYAVLDDTDTDTLGSLVVFVHVAGALTVRVECVVLAANVYDALVAASDKLQVHADEITNGLITAAAVATGAIDADALAADAVTEIADEVLKRDWTLVTGAAARSVLNALRLLRNKVSISGSTMTVTEEDDTTGAWTATVTTNASANPVTAVDPD
jgi:hypothetical protein